MIQVPANFELVFSPEQINKMIANMAEQIRKAYPADAEIVCVGVLKGAWMFHADLVRALNREVFVDFMRASSYGGGTQTSGVVRILKDIEVDIRGKHVLLIEEIVDSGRTLSFIQQRLANGDAASVKIAALLDKRARREVPCEPDFVGAQVENHFLVGYGLDWGEKYRYLPGVYKVQGEKLH